MRVLGIDPGLGRTGIAIVDGRATDIHLVYAACIETIPQTAMAGRLTSLLAQVEDVVREYSPDVAAVETLLFSTNRSTAIAVAQARGVILCAIGRAGVECVEYGPNQVKEAVAGFGGARKPQVANMVNRLLGTTKIGGPDDTTDACAVAICHHHRARLGPTRSAAIANGTLSASSAGPRLEAAIAAAQSRLARASR